MGFIGAHAISRRQSRNLKGSRQQQMQDRLEHKRQVEKETFDKWFDQFDADGSKSLDRDEVKQLVMTLQQIAPSEGTVDRILKEMSFSSSSARDVIPEEEPLADPPAAAAGSSSEGGDSSSSSSSSGSGSGATAPTAAPCEEDEHPQLQRFQSINKEQLRAAVQRNMSYIKEQQYLDNIFDRYDVDKSGFLERAEVKSLMQAAARGDVLTFAPGDPCAQEAACISYKLKCLDDLKKKGIINEKVWRDKRANIAKRHQSIMSPRLSDRDPDDADINFVLEQCDKNNDHKISREELLTAIGLWIQVSQDPDGKDMKSSVCLVM